MSDHAPITVFSRLLEKLTASRTLPERLPPDPFPLFVEWFNEAKAAKASPNPDAMSLATIDADGTPSVRMVLCRGIDVGAGTVTFYTNYEGRKGRALLGNPRAAVCFHWDHAERQVRMEGTVTKASEAASDAYFASRNWESRVGAWASEQSQPIGSRAELFARAEKVLKDLGISLAEVMVKGNGIHVPRPPHWGGFVIRAERVELWLGNASRFHDRAEWRREGGGWRGTRVCP